MWKWGRSWSGGFNYARTRSARWERRSFCSCFTRKLLPVMDLCNSSSFIFLEWGSPLWHVIKSTICCLQWYHLKKQEKVSLEWLAVGGSWLKCESSVACWHAVQRIWEKTAKMTSCSHALSNLLILLTNCYRKLEGREVFAYFKSPIVASSIQLPALLHHHAISRISASRSWHFFLNSEKPKSSVMGWEQEEPPSKPVDKQSESEAKE